MNQVLIVEDTNLVEVSEDDEQVLIVESPDQVVVAEGFVGPAGPTGPQGPAGNSEATLSYLHTQSAPLAVFTITHPLPFPPAAVLAIDSLDDIMEFDTVEYPTSTTVRLTFGVPFSGVVRLS